MIKLSPQPPRVEGLSLAAAAGSGRVFTGSSKMVVALSSQG